MIGVVIAIFIIFGVVYFITDEPDDPWGDE